MKIEGEMRIGEAARWAMKACAPLTGYPRNLIAIFAAIPVIVLLVVGIPTWIVTEWDAPQWVYWLSLVLIGWPVIVGFSRLSRHWQVGRMTRALGQRGVPNPIAVGYEAGDNALTVRQGAVEWNAPWSIITDLNPVGPYWVFLAQGTPLYLPKRCFASPAEEAAFLRDCLNRVSPEARSRSRKAVAFVDGVAGA